MPNHSEIYKQAKYYDIAFDFKDVRKECDFLEAVVSEVTGREPRSYIELGAGPANSAIEFASRGLKVTALDISPHMAEYGLFKAEKAGVAMEYLVADMTDYQVTETVDLAALLMDSAAYLLDNEAVYRNFRCVADSLNDGGIYVLEMTHPRDVFGLSASTRGQWTNEREGITVTCRWGSGDDSLDPITQVSKVTAEFQFKDGDKEGVVVETAPQRCFTVNEFRALVDASGVFKIARTYGAMDQAIPFSNDENAWRMVQVLVRT